MRVLLLAGGWSDEREVSLAGARVILDALNSLGHEPLLCDLADGFDTMLDMAADCDFAFLNLHGAPGEDGLVQALLEAVGCPYQGADPRGSQLALNKAAAKHLFRRAGLVTPDWELVPPPSLAPGASTEDPEPTLPLPVFVKPNIGGSSLGMSLVRESGEYAPALDLVFRRGGEALVETLTEGLEVTCAVLDNEPLPPILIKPADSSTFFDYESKYVPGAAQEICPAPIGDDATRAVMDGALKAHEALGLKGYSRSDFILTSDGPSILEVNTLPGMTATSLLPQSAAVAGYDFPSLIQKLMDLGLARS